MGQVRDIYMHGEIPFNVPSRQTCIACSRFNRDIMANPSSIVENDEVSLELAATLVNEEHINEFEAILDDSLQEIF